MFLLSTLRLPLLPFSIFAPDSCYKFTQAILGGLCVNVCSSYHFTSHWINCYINLSVRYKRKDMVCHHSVLWPRPSYNHQAMIWRQATTVCFVCALFSLSDFPSKKNVQYTETVLSKKASGRRFGQTTVSSLHNWYYSSLFFVAVHCHFTTQRVRSWRRYAPFSLCSIQPFVQ